LEPLSTLITEVNGGRQPDRALDSSRAFLGKEYSATEIRGAIESRSVAHSFPPDLIHKTASLLATGHVIGMHQGRSEFGPRALGHRSIIASPFSTSLRDHINLNIKERESFRPLAPIITSERASDFFDLRAASPFMQFPAVVKSRYRDALQGITHVDGSARLQTLDRVADPFLFDVINCFESLTGFPILINTSFNRRGEPIVETPADALDCFLATPIDYLVMGECLVEKHTPWNNRKSCSFMRIDKPSVR